MIVLCKVTMRIYLTKFIQFYKPSMKIMFVNFYSILINNKSIQSTEILTYKLKYDVIFLKTENYFSVYKHSG